MTASKRPARLRPFVEDDYGALNAFGKPLNGWKSLGLNAPDGTRQYGHVNAMGFGLFQVVHQKAAGDAWQDLYDQFILFENPGAMVVCTDGDGRVGLVQNYRMVGDRLQSILDRLKDGEGKYDFAAYVRVLKERQLFGEAVDGLGEYVWELPRGLAPAGKTDDFAAFVKKVASIEAKEEGGFDVTDVRLRGKVNANTTFFPHSQAVLSARIVGKGENRPEELETIGKVRMFAPDELRAMCDKDELYDGLTLASLLKVGYTF